MRISSRDLIGFPAMIAAGDDTVIVQEDVGDVTRIGAVGDVVRDGLPDRHQRQLHHPVPGQLADIGVERRVVGDERLEIAGKGVVVLVDEVGLEGGAHQRPILVAGSALGEIPLGHRPGLEQLAVGGAHQVVVQAWMPDPGWRDRPSRPPDPRRARGGA